MPKILVVEDTESLREVLCTVLACEGYGVDSAASAEEALVQIRAEDFSLILCDLKLPNKSGLDLLAEVKSLRPQVPFVVMTAYGSINTAVEAMKLGAADFITKPFDPQALCYLVRSVTATGEKLASGAQRVFITQSAKIEQLLKQASKVAPLASTVLILGESGTGKELLARYLHDQSLRSAAPFVAVNCGSVPEELLESEFFGHEAGAFTGAAERKTGLFEVADGGTLFLDEIGIMPAALQVKLLRSLQESEIRRVGATKTVKIDTRVIAATNCDLEEEIKAGRFREDLYYRLGVVVLNIPPLRERREDIAPLIKYFTRLYATEFNRPPPIIAPETLRYLESYDWPGNIRELENVVQRAVIFADTVLEPHHFQLYGTTSPALPLPAVTAQAVREAEISAIGAALAQTKGNKLAAAKLLAVSYKTLLNKIKEYSLG